jgi:hypothetical protein
MLEGRKRGISLQVVAFKQVRAAFFTAVYILLSHGSILMKGRLGALLYLQLGLGSIRCSIALRKKGWNENLRDS